MIWNTHPVARLSDLGERQGDFVKEWEAGGVWEHSLGFEDSLRTRAWAEVTTSVVHQGNVFSMNFHDKKTILKLFKITVLAVVRIARPETVQQKGTRQPWGTCYCWCVSRTWDSFKITFPFAKPNLLLSSTNCKVKRASLPQGMFSSTWKTLEFHNCAEIFFSLVSLFGCHSNGRTFSSQYS